MILQVRKDPVFDQFLTTYFPKIQQEFPNFDNYSVVLCDSDFIRNEPCFKMLEYSIDPDSIFVNQKFWDTFYIIRNNSLSSNYSQEEQIALIAHEGGHIFAICNKKDSGDINEELFADGFALKICTRSDLLSAIGHLLSHFEEKKLDPLSRLFDNSIQTTIDDLCHRMTRLKSLN